jgi:ubiquitin carboxyl-terminal hydrolase 36/42
MEREQEEPRRTFEAEVAEEAVALRKKLQERGVIGDKCPSNTSHCGWNVTEQAYGMTFQLPGKVLDGGAGQHRGGAKKMGRGKRKRNRTKGGSNKSSQHTPGWTPSQDAGRAPPQGVAAGLERRSAENTCYCNSVLQVLLHTPAFVNACLEGRAVRHALPVANNTTEPEPDWLRLLQDLAQNALAQPRSTGSIAPENFHDALAKLPGPTEFNRHQQSDANEFLETLLERIRHAEDCQRSSTPSGSGENAQTQIGNILGHQQSIVNKCQVCGAASQTRSAVHTIPLPVPEGGSNAGSGGSAWHPTCTLEEAMQLAMASAPLESFTCSNCRDEVHAHSGQPGPDARRHHEPTTETRFWSLPDVMAFQLKLFQWSRTTGQGKASPAAQGRKSNVRVIFPLTLDVSPWLMQEVQNRLDQHTAYSLYAVIVHDGPSLDSGHYYALISPAPGIWYKMDDARVQQMTTRQVQDDRPYMLFYRQSASPPLAFPVLEPGTSALPPLEGITGPSAA